MILEAQHEVLFGIVNGLSTDDQTMVDQFRSANPDESAEFFRKVLGLRDKIENECGCEWAEEFYTAISALMKSNLALDQTGYGPGQGSYTDCFLCTDLADKDMPWESVDFDW
jgi:hypothetical protein